MKLNTTSLQMFTEDMVHIISQLETEDVLAMLSIAALAIGGLGLVCCCCCLLRLFQRR